MNDRVQAIFETVIGLRPAERDAILDEECGSDDELRQEVESLLAAHADAGAFLDSPTIGATVLLERPTDDAIDAPTHALPGGAAKPPAVPQQLGPVRLVREIGRAGMGSVWLGRDEVLHRDVAVKFVLNITATRDSREVELFLEGARAAAAVDHPGLTTIHHADVVEDVPYLVMDYVRGASLAEVLKQRGSLSIAQTAAVLNATCDVLSALHDAEIVHRDIKPSNILLSRDGRLLVTDFGLACERVAPGRSVRVKGLMGTPAYMAPEMFDGVISPRTDIYALGVTAYELLTGETPFSGESEIRREGEARTLPREKLEQRNVPEALIDLIERMTNRNAMFRLKSARQVQQILEKAVGELPAATNRIFADLLSNVQPSSVREAGSTSGDDASSASDLATLAAQKREAQKRMATDDRSGTDRSRPTSDPPQPEAIPAKVLCLGCEYDLQGLRVDAPCPECGLPASVNMSPDRIHLAPVEVIRRIQRGTRLIGWAVMVHICVAICFAAILLIIMGRWQAEQIEESTVVRLYEVGTVAYIILGTMLPLIAVVMGFWSLTSRDVAGTETGYRVSTTTVRLGTVALAIIAALATLILIPMLLLGQSENTRWTFIGDTLVEIILTAFLLIIAISLWVAAALFKEIPDRPARRFALVTVGMLAGTVLAMWLLTLTEPVVELAGVVLDIDFILYSLMAAGAIAYLAMFGGLIAACLVMRRLDRQVGELLPQPERLRPLIALAGERMSDMAADGSGPQPLPAPADGSVPASILCLGCGHDLRGLPAGGRCAECGMPLSRNLSPDRIFLAPADGLRRLARGAQLAGWGVALLFLYWIAYPTLILLEDLSGVIGNEQGGATGLGQMHPGGTFTLFVLATVHIATLLVLCRGAWHLAEPNVGPRHTIAWRRAARGLLSIATIGGVIGWIIWIGYNLGILDNVGVLVRSIMVTLGWVASEEAPYVCFAMALLLAASRWSDIPITAARRIAQVLGWLLIVNVFVNGFSSFVLVLAVQSPDPGGIAMFIENSTLLVGAIIVGGVSWMAFVVIAFAGKFIAWFLFRRFRKQILSHVDAAEPLRRFIGIANADDPPSGSSTNNPSAS